MKKPLLDAQTKALIELGFINPVDVVIAAMLMLSLVVGILRAEWTTHCVVSAVFLLLLWLVLLAYRIMYFVLRVTAEIKGMPAEAAKLAIRFMRTA